VSESKGGVKIYTPGVVFKLFIMYFVS